jgi:hypothetical protein
VPEGQMGVNSASWLGSLPAASGEKPAELRSAARAALCCTRGDARAYIMLCCTRGDARVYIMLWPRSGFPGTDPSPIPEQPNKM